MNVKTSTRLAAAEGSIDPDTFHWQDDARSLLVREEIATDLPSDAIAESEGVSISHRLMRFDLVRNALIEESGMPAAKGAMRLSPADTGMEIAAASWTITLPNPAGGDDNEFIGVRRDGSAFHTRFKAEQIRVRSPQGIAFTNAEGRNLNLYALGGGNRAPADAQPAIVAIATSVSYYIPNPAGSTVNFTQVGQGYSGGGCLLKNHLTGSSMAYALDIQLSGSTYDDVLASADGTVSSWTSSVTCNAVDNGSDGTSCALYASPCSSNSGWGNTVILAHADGYYTKYAHLEQTNFQVHTSGANAWAGCWLGREGRTGNTSGAKNGCGDHLHFQKQATGGLNDNSVALSFVEDGSITSSDCTTKSPAHGGMSCSL